MVKYNPITISEDSSAEDIASVARAFHELLGLPVTMRSLNRKGVRIEKGKVLDYNYTGPVLEQVLDENRLVRMIPTSGKYAGTPVVVAPVRNKEGYAVAAIGIVDMVGTVDLGLMFHDYPDVVNEVQTCLMARVKSP